jgi:hypothetical protein
VVPTRDSRTGLPTEFFRDIFAARRRRSLRADVDAAAWGTFERLGINTRGAGADGDIATVSCGSEVSAEPVPGPR